MVHGAAAFCLRNTADNVVEVALQQTGSKAAKRSADRALAADRQHAGVIRVTVRELETINEHAIFLGGEVSGLFVYLPLYPCLHVAHICPPRAHITSFLRCGFFFFTVVVVASGLTRCAQSYSELSI
jgi:hypothetical protein